MTNSPKTILSRLAIDAAWWGFDKGAGKTIGEDTQKEREAMLDKAVAEILQGLLAEMPEVVKPDKVNPQPLDAYERGYNAGVTESRRTAARYFTTGDKIDE